MDEIHPVDSNLVLSTDDTILFVFEGTSNDGCNDDWEWKLVDKTEAGSSVHSDFQVSNNAEMGSYSLILHHIETTTIMTTTTEEKPTRKNH